MYSRFALNQFKGDFIYSKVVLFHTQAHTQTYIHTHTHTYTFDSVIVA